MGLGLGIGIGIDSVSGVSKPNGNPSALTLTVLSDTSIKCDWTNGATNQDGTYIYISTDNVNFTNTATALGSLTTKTLTGLTANTTYYIKVVHYKGSKLSNYSSIVNDTTFITQYSLYYSECTEKPSKTWASYQNEFFKTLVDGGVFAKMSGAWLWANHTNDNGEALINIINPSGTRASLHGTTYYKDLIGFRGDAATGYINLNINPKTETGGNITVNSFCSGAYCYRATNNTGWDLGVSDGTNSSALITFNAAPLYNRVYQNDGYVIINPGGYYTGLKCINRSSSSAVQLYANGASYGGTKASVAIPDLDIYALALNNNGTASGFTDRDQAFCFISSSLSEAEMTIINTAITNYINHVPLLDSGYNALYDSNAYADYGYLSGINIVYQKDEVILIHKNNELKLSKDSGVTWSDGLSFTPDNDIEFAYVFDNYNILFAVKDHLYKSTDELATYSEVVITDIGGGSFIPSATGNNFQITINEKKKYINGIEMCIWGNYGNVFEGNNESNVFYAKNDCSVKIIYKFGQNPNYGSLGDATNSTICRHIHAVSINDLDSSIWVQTGDEDLTTPTRYECHWIKGVYDSENDTFIFTNQFSGTQSGYYKTLGMLWKGDYTYWASDSDNDSYRGFYRCLTANLADSSEYELLSQVVGGNWAAYYENDITIGGTSNNVIVVSKDLGVTDNSFYPLNTGISAGLRFVMPMEKDNNSWYAIRPANPANNIHNIGTVRIRLK